MKDMLRIFNQNNQINVWPPYERIRRILDCFAIYDETLTTSNASDDHAITSNYRPNNAAGAD